MFRAERISDFLGLTKSTVGLLFMVVLVGMGERMAERFLPIYILVYILFGKIKRWLPFFRKIARILDQYDREGAEKMIRITDLVANPEVPRQGDCA